MISRTLSLYKNAYSGLSPSTWWLSFIMLVNRSGTMVLPFMTIYLTASKGYSIGMAGVVMALFGLGAVTGAFLGGKLTDRIGYYPVQLIALLGGGVLFMVLGQMQSFPLICLFTYLLSLVNEAFRPANSTAIVAYSKDNTRTRSYALHRLAINLGWAVGSALGGVLAARSYQLLFWVDGATNIMAALLLVYLLRPSKQAKPVKEETVKDPLHSAYRDKIYLWFILLTILFATCFFQLFTNLNAYYKIVLHFNEQFIGLIGAVNGIMIAVIEMVLVFKLENRRSSLFYIIRGTMLVGIAYLMLNIFHIDHIMALLMIIVMTMGEILVLPFMNTFWTSRSADHNRGEYAGLYTIAWSIAQTAGPFLASQLAERAGFTALWWALGAMSFATAAGFFWLKKKLEG
ncbi:MDR family MFS transporter [Niastella populi]|uniref:MFS transporter n=1 Tax=Niastella populi TaxID=550983 RepID=A0A1V9FXQ3_9BACT|nr:MFS transporter [Niastella populi]OQP63016.1 MFS transporter [Niastella populi]